MVGREGIGGIGACLGAVEWRIVELQIPSTLLASMAEGYIIYSEHLSSMDIYLPRWKRRGSKKISCSIKRITLQGIIGTLYTLYS